MKHKTQQNYQYRNIGSHIVLDIVKENQKWRELKTDQLHRLQLNFVSLLFTHALFWNILRIEDTLATNWKQAWPWSPSVSSLEHRQQTPQCRIPQPEHCLDQNQKPMQTNLKPLDIIGSNAMLQQGLHQQWPKSLFLFSLCCKGYAQFADSKQLQIKMEIILTTLKRRIRPALVPPQPTLEPVASQLPSSFVRLIWNRQSLNSTLWEPLAAVEKYHIILMKFVVWFGLVMWTNRRACWCYNLSHWQWQGSDETCTPI